MALEFYTSVTKELGVAKLRGIIPTFIEVIGEKLVVRFFAQPPPLKRVKRFLKSLKCSKIIAELTFTTQNANACSLLDWLFCFIVPFLGKFGPKTQIVSLS